MKQSFSPSASKFFAIILALSLLFAQALGLLHDIAHSGLHHHDGRTQAVEQSDAVALLPVELSVDDVRDLALFGHVDDEGHGDHLSCKEFAAAAIAAVIHIYFLLLLAVLGTHVLQSWQSDISWDAPLRVCFSSRAPPD